MSMFKNMSGPPKSSVTKKIVQIDKEICFSPVMLATLLKCKTSELEETINKYLNTHTLNYNKSPKNYMICKKEILTKKSKKIEYCKDIDLLLIVIGRTVNDFYIPNRELEFDEFSLKYSYIYLEGDVKNG